MPSPSPPLLHPPHLAGSTLASALPKAGPDSPTSSLPASARGRCPSCLPENSSLTTLVCFTYFELSEFKDSILSPLHGQNLAQSKHSLKACGINTWRARHVHKLSSRLLALQQQLHELPSPLLFHKCDY